VRVGREREAGASGHPRKGPIVGRSEGEPISPQSVSGSVTRPKYLVRLANDRGFAPRDWQHASDIANKAVRELGGRVGATRIGTKVVGFHLLLQKNEDIDEALRRLSSAMGSVTSWRQLGVPREPKPKEELIEDAKELFNEERFWECHETLERLWLEVGGKDVLSTEVEVLHGLILVAAAFVHYQRAEDEVALSVLRRALRNLDAWQEDHYLSLDTESLKQNLRGILDSGVLHSFPLQ